MTYVLQAMSLCHKLWLITRNNQWSSFASCHEFASWNNCQAILEVLAYNCRFAFWLWFSVVYITAWKPLQRRFHEWVAVCSECEHVVQIASACYARLWSLRPLLGQRSVQLSRSMHFRPWSTKKINAMKTFTFEECVVELQQKKQRPFDMDTNLVSISGQQVQSKHLE